jgi:PAS domain S-box-containing protein
MSDIPKSKSQLLNKKASLNKKSGQDISKTKKTVKTGVSLNFENNPESILKELPYIVTFFDKKGTFLRIVETSRQKLSFKPPKYLLGKTLHDVFPKQQADLFLENITKVIKTKHPVSLEYNLLIKKARHWFSTTVSAVDKNSVMIISVDRTGQKNTKETDKNTLQLFRLAWENSNDGMRLTNNQGIVLKVNEAYCRLVGKTKKELEGKLLNIVYGKGFKYTATKTHQGIFNEVNANSYFEYETTLWNKKVLWFGISSSFFKIANQEPCLLCIFNDITERKLNEAKISQAFSLLNATIESTADGILVVDLDGTITGMNQKFTKMWNVPLNLTSSKNENKLLKLLQDKIKEPDKFISRINWLYEFPESESIDTIEFKDGKIFERYSIPQKIDGKVVGRVWNFRDITEKKISEEALIESEKRFRSLFEASAEGICIISDKYEECNARLCNLLGRKKEEITGHASWEFAPNIQPNGVNSKEYALEKINLAHMGIPQYFYWQYLRSDNSVIDTEVSIKSVIVGKKNLIQATIHDITERKRFEKIQNALYKISEAVNTTEDIQTLYSNIHEVIKSLMAADNFYIALYDEEENILTFPYFLDEFDQTPIPRKPGGGLTEYVLKTGKDYIITSEDDLELREKGVVDLVGEPAAVWVGVALKHEGHIIGVMAVQDYYNKNAYGEIEKQILVFVSEQIALAIDRKRTSDELINYTKQLKANKDLLEERARELAQLNSQLAESERRLQDLNISKDKLFSIVAHDLKGPFQPLLGLSDILVEDYDNLTHEEQVKFIKEMNNSLKNQYKLVENLLDWSRLQTGRMPYNPEKINLFETAESNFQMFRPKSEIKNILLFNDVPQNIFVFADVYMLQSIIQNLVSNSIKFTDSGGTIAIKAKSDGDKVIISISDTGVGISKSDIDKIFRIDMQYTTLGTEKEKGTGLGLIICKELVERNGGKIWIESEINKGSEFFITLPRS